MALTDKLTAVADAIRAKTGKTDSMTLAEMPSEIESIETGGGETPANPIIEALSVTENGTYTAPNGVDGYSPVTVNVPTGGGGDSESVAALLGNTMTVLDNSLVTSLRTRACQAATKLVTVNLPNVTSLGAYAFYQCSGLVTVKVPKLTTISTQTWYMCPQLERADCGQLGNISAQTFNSCAALKTLILRKTSSICTLSNANGVSGSGIGKGTGYVYVPYSPAFLDSYKSATNWSTVASQFRPLVATSADLASIDGSVYDRAFVDDEYCVYIYDGSSWAKEA